MGSVDEFEKGQTPFLDRVKEHNRRYQDSIERCARAAPLWVRWAARFGMVRPLYEWQIAHQHEYWGDE